MHSRCYLQIIMNLLYLTFGNNPTIHSQTAFSVYSFLSQPAAVGSVNIITDNTSFYQHLLPHANLIQVTKDELEEWKGKHSFFWRIKIKAIERICKLYPGEPVLYLDTDTCLLGDAEKIKNDFYNGRAFMHDDEGYLSAKTTKTQKNMWRQIAGKTFGNLQMQPVDHMWNAGVVGTPNTEDGADCKLALAICDEMCGEGVTRYFIEQYALSLSLEKTYGLLEAKTEIVHYWSAKELWTGKIDDFFLEAYFAKWDVEKILANMKQLDLSGLPVYQKVKSTNVRLKGLVDKFFPNSNKVFMQ